MATDCLRVKQNSSRPFSASGFRCTTPVKLAPGQSFFFYLTGRCAASGGAER